MKGFIEIHFYDESKCCATGHPYLVNINNIRDITSLSGDPNEQGCVFALIHVTDRTREHWIIAESYNEVKRLIEDAQS